MKHVYIVRHGESVANAAGLRQGISEGLSEKGRRQAELLADRFGRIPIDMLVSSPYPRAKETAEILAHTLRKEILFSPLARERENPTEILGRRMDDPEVTTIQEKIFSLWLTGSGKYSDEESFSDLHERAKAFAAFILERPEQNIFVVSHGFFLRMFLSHVIFGNELTPQEFLKITASHPIYNASIAYFQYRDQNENGGSEIWRLITWNDFAHLR